MRIRRRRLHRLYDRKREVRIFDYVDRDMPMLARMFEKRLRGYRAIGYELADPPADTGAEVTSQSSNGMRRHCNGAVIQSEPDHLRKPFQRTTRNARGIWPPRLSGDHDAGRRAQVLGQRVCMGGQGSNWTPPSQIAEIKEKKTWAGGTEDEQQGDDGTSQNEESDT